MSLVLDVDGVILRNPKLLAHVRRNCERYIKLKLPSTKRPAYTNRVLYGTYGHTAVGLEKLFDIDTSDFNKKVYDTTLMAHLWEVLESTEFQADARIIHDLSSRWRVTLFSNAPLAWIGTVARAINDDTRFVAANPYKPHAHAYLPFETNMKHVFVDDSIENLRTVQWLSNWEPICFGGQPDWGCKTVNSLPELAEYLSVASS